MRLAPVALASLVLVGLTSAAADASACTCGLGPGRFLVEDDAVLPSNAKGILWWGGGFLYSAECVAKACANDTLMPSVVTRPFRGEFSVAKVVGAKEEVVSHTVKLVEQDDRHLTGWRSSEAVLLAVTEPFEPGARYRFRHAAEGSLDETVEVQVSKESVESATVRLEVSPGAFGDLKVGAGLSCSEEVNTVYRTLRMALPSRIEKYAGALRFTTLVDGKPWRAEESMCSPPPIDRSWVGRGRDRLFAACGTDWGPPLGALNYNLEEGSHQVEMRADLPGTDVAVTTEPTMIEWRCSAGSPAPVAPSGPPPAASAASPGPRTDARGCSGCVVGAPTGRRPASWAWIAAAVWSAVRRSRSIAAARYLLRATG